MMDILLDPKTHDIKLVNRDISLLRDGDLVGQRIKQRLLTYLGEWFLDATIGLPWNELIFQKGFPINLIRSYIIRVIVLTVGIESLDTFELDVNSSTREMFIKFEATLTQEYAGTAIVQEITL